MTTTQRRGRNRLASTTLCLALTTAGSVLLSMPASDATQDLPGTAAMASFSDIGETIALRKEAAAQYAVDHAGELAARR